MLALPSFLHFAVSPFLAFYSLHSPFFVFPSACFTAAWFFAIHPSFAVGAIRRGEAWGAAPEVLEGRILDGEAAEIWALGATLYHIISGEPPWQHCQKNWVGRSGYLEVRPAHGSHVLFKLAITLMLLRHSSQAIRCHSRNFPFQVAALPFTSPPATAQVSRVVCTVFFPPLPDRFQRAGISSVAALSPVPQFPDPPIPPFFGPFYGRRL